MCVAAPEGAFSASMRPVFHSPAERELIAAAKFYETCALGLAAEFIQHVERRRAEVVANPSAGNPFASGTIRRRLLPAAGQIEGL